MTPQNPEELSVWLAVFKSRVRDGLLFESAEDEANAALAEHRDRVGTKSPVDIMCDAIERSVSARINEMSERLHKVEAESGDLRRMGMLSPQLSNSDSSLTWLAEVMRHAPPPEHSAPYGAYMQTVRELMQHADAMKADKTALADVQREYDELVREHAAAMDVEQAKRQVERGETLRELGKLHELLAAASGYVTDVFHLSADPEQRARVRKLLHEIGKVISPTLIALPNDGE